MMKIKIVMFYCTRQIFYKKSLFILILALMGCDGNNTHSLSANSIIYCSEGDPESFNPQLTTNSTSLDATSHQFYNRLLSFDSTQKKLKPSLAKSWEISENGKSITFNLRKNVSFHQTSYFTPTRNFNADDVLFSFERIINPDNEFHAVSGGSYPYFKRIKFSQTIKSIEKINDYQVVFNLYEPHAQLLANLSSDFSVILSQEYAQLLIQQNKKSQIDSLPIGTGPFLLKDYRVGAFIRYLPHPNYWRKDITIKQLIFDITPSNTGRLTKLLAGECDIVGSPIAHQRIKQRSDLILDSITSYDIAYLGLNTKTAPLNNKLVRQAIARAINKNAIIETIYLGKATPANSLFPSHSWVFNEALPPLKYSPSYASKMLIEAGYPEGIDIELWVSNIPSAFNPDPLTMGSLIKSNLAKAGIRVSIISSLSPEEFSLGIKKGRHQMVLSGWSSNHSEPDELYSPLLGCDSLHNTTFWCHEGFSDLLLHSLQTRNITLRKRYYAKAMTLIRAEVPLIPIAHPIHYQARSAHIKGVSIKSIGGLDFQEVSKE